MIALDIGAGSTDFSKALKQLNPSVSTVIAGDITFQKQEYEAGEIRYNIGVFLSRFSSILSGEELARVIENTRRGVFRIYAQYDNIPLSDASVDIVTLNSPHPHPCFFPTRRGFEEFQRVLRPGGIFYFGHSTHIRNGFDPGSMRSIGEGVFGFGAQRRAELPEYGLRFPMSPYIREKLIALLMQERNRSCCIYGSGPTKIPLYPNWKAWEKL